MLNRKIILIIHDVRSAQNVGSMLRTADGIAIEKVYMTGYTPYPHIAKDRRLPHESRKVAAQIHKTALGAEDMVDWSQKNNIAVLLNDLKNRGYQVVALEQTSAAIDISSYNPPLKSALIVGNEISGINQATLKAADSHVKLPMLGKKESYNVAVAAAIALFHLRFTT